MREEKVSVVEELQNRLQTSPYLIVTDYEGLKVDQFSELRDRLHETSAEIHVVKNTFLRKALEAEKLPEIDNYLKGQTAVVSGESDITGAAKILKNFASEFERPTVRVGFLDRAVVDADQLKALASLPAKEIILAQLLGLINRPASLLATVINTPATQLAQVIKAKAEKGE